MDIEEWLDEISAASKREKKWRKEGKEILDIYEAEDDSTVFNILYSNTEVLAPAIYSRLPRPSVARRYRDKDPLGKAVCEACNRMLEYLMDTDLEGYDTFDNAINSDVLDGLLPGRGVTAVKYEADLSEGEDGEPDDVEYETVCLDKKKWDRVLFGFAHKWVDVPWVAFIFFMDKEDAKKKFGDIAESLKYTTNEEEDHENEHYDEDEKDKGNRKTALVYQIWDKSSRQIIYLSPQHKEDFLLVEDDPLEIPGFFNIPKPIQFVKKSTNLKPVSPYKMYKRQAEELNKVSRRLEKVVDAIKVRGVYDGNLGDELEELFSGEDNTLVPTDKTASLLEGGFDKAIWMIPIGELIAVAQQLYNAREAAKQVIYEITGISDIVRGQSRASETLGAQKIKEAWGTMRLKSLQKEGQRYVLDLMRIMLNVAISKFDEQTWAKMTGLPFPTTEQVDRARNLLEMAQRAAKPPAPGESKEVDQAVQIMQATSWKQVLDSLSNHFDRYYKIDIETNSTLEAEASEDKQQVAEFMNAFAQLVNGMAPMVKDGTLPFPAFKSMALAVVRRYQFGREVEDELESMQEPQQGMSPEVQKLQQQLQKQQEQLQKEQQGIEQQKQQLNQRVQDEAAKLEQQERKVEEAKMSLDFERKLMELEVDYQRKVAEVETRLENEEAEMQLKQMTENHRREIQSMIDKHMVNVEKRHNDFINQLQPEAIKEANEAKEKAAPVINIVNQIPTNKSINIERQDGFITGATVTGEVDG